MTVRLLKTAGALLFAVPLFLAPLAWSQEAVDSAPSPTETEVQSAQDDSGMFPVYRPDRVEQDENLALIRSLSQTPEDLVFAIDKYEKTSPGRTARTVRFLYTLRQETLGQIDSAMQGLYDESFDILSQPERWTDQVALNAVQAMAGKQ